MYTRPQKSSHLDTVRYEIDMLRFCLERLRTNPGQREQGEENLLIEGFLLHYRNLLEFFSAAHHRDDDLSTKDPKVWAGRNLTQAEIAAILAPAKALDKTYFQITSKYLQHCTEQRYLADRKWDLDQMYREIEPILIAFEGAFLGRTVTIAKSPAEVSAAHTATVTSYKIFPE